MNSIENYFVVSNICSTPEWKHIFTSILNHCDQFEVVYPDGEFDSENPLMGGKFEFEKLEGTFVKPWDGMESSISIFGELTSLSRRIFYKLEEPSFEGLIPELWCFKLFKDGTLFLSVEDFSVCLLEKNQEVISLLGDKGISSDIFDW